AIFNDERSPVFPDLMTTGEQGYKGFGGGAWSGMLVPKGTPEHIVNLLSGEIRKIVAQNRQSGALYIPGIQVPRSSTPQEMAAMMREEVARWQRVAREVGIKPDEAPR